MSKVLREKIDELFEATKHLKSLEEIQPHCEKFNEWLKTQNYSIDSLGTVLSRAGFYKQFKSISLEQGQNADTIPVRDKEGNLKGHELRHYAVLLCGLKPSEWKERNETTRVIDRLGNDQEIDPDAYLEVTGQLLESSNPHELAVGLIAATGRRPHEILARAKFTPIEGEAYQVQFEGQGKKRGDKPVFSIPVLFPADYIIKCLQRLRREPSTKALLKEVAAEFPKTYADQNQAIDSRRNGSLNRVVREYFGDKGNNTPVLPFRHGEEQDNNKALRAAYAALVTERDCNRSVGSKMLYFARVLGHFVHENPTDKELQAVATSLGYADYFTSKPVPSPGAPVKEKTHSIRVNESDLEALKKLQEVWKLPNQQSVVSRLIERHEKVVELGKQLQDYKSQINQLEKEKKQMAEIQAQLEKEKAEQSQAQPQSATVDMSALEAKLEQMIEQIVEEKLSKALSNITVNQLESQAKPTRKEPVQEVIDWSGVSHADLWGTKVKGASEEKIRRSFEAIATYNDTIATGDDDRLAITNQALRELSGVNGLIVGDWIKAHSDEVITHNLKHGMQPLDQEGNPAKDKKTGEVRTDSYYNKRHGKEKTTKILQLINSEFLDGEAPVR